ncbi:hypothetical protein [Saccharothrix texasensis]|uniref:DUF2637 domain-containing protein n=1 Tax=Saccharothrix texasensis TaxID=103734 RepID=A0A3N1H4H1_9PSEU|nr:hypothetical protein [Saccharothrix texasensis]ROP37420.1 hypothetical protein EDD40_2733 [Saccharothrix texasensis]
MNTDAQRLERTGRVIAGATWVIAGVVMIYGLLTVTPWLVQQGIPPWSAWMLPPAVDAALVLALVGDRVLAQHGRSTGWGVALRAVTGLVTLGLNVAPSALKGDGVGIALHAVGPVLLWVATEAAGAYQRAFAGLAADLARQAGAPGEAPADLATPAPAHLAGDLVHQIGNHPAHQAGEDLADMAHQAPGEDAHQPGDQPGPAHLAEPGDDAHQVDQEPAHQAHQVSAEPVRQVGEHPVSVPRQAPRRPAEVDPADLVERARAVLATARQEGRQVGRTRLAKELGITEHQARRVLADATRPRLAAVAGEVAGRG